MFFYAKSGNIVGMTLSEELAWRGFINQTTIQNIADLDEKKLKFYHGYDASADSLTIGNLAAVMMDKVFIRNGYEPIILAGGATSMIGDPGGKDSERPMQTVDDVTKNVHCVQGQLEWLFGQSVTMVNNLDWYKDMNVLEFLRDVGKHFSMTPLVQRDYIAKRIGEGGSGISYTELSYTLLQGYDYLYLHKKFGVDLQIAGGDQWGNSLSGVDLIRRVENKTVDVITCPLIINSTTGKKFGKSEDGAVWLDPKKTSPYKFYQFWLNIDDKGVEGYLKIFTELDKPAVDSLMGEFNANKSERKAQKTLAYEVTKLVHGQEAADSIVRVTETLFGSQNYENLTADDFVGLKSELPFTEVKTGHSVVAVLVSLGLASSNTEARRFVEQGGVYVNGQQCTTDKALTQDDTIDGHHLIVRRGKNANGIVQLDN